MGIQAFCGFPGCRVGWVLVLWGSGVNPKQSSMRPLPQLDHPKAVKTADWRELLLVRNDFPDSDAKTKDASRY